MFQHQPRAPHILCWGSSVQLPGILADPRGVQVPPGMSELGMRGVKLHSQWRSERLRLESLDPDTA